MGWFMLEYARETKIQRQCMPSAALRDARIADIAARHGAKPEKVTPWTSPHFDMGGMMFMGERLVRLRLSRARWIEAFERDVETLLSVVRDAERAPIQGAEELGKFIRFSSFPSCGIYLSESDAAALLTSERQVFEREVHANGRHKAWRKVREGAK